MNKPVHPATLCEDPNHSWKIRLNFSKDFVNKSNPNLQCFRHHILIWSVHLFNGDYLSIPEGTGSCGYFFHEIPGSTLFFGFTHSVIEKLIENTYNTCKMAQKRICE